MLNGLEAHIGGGGHDIVKLLHVHRSSVSCRVIIRGFELVVWNISGLWTFAGCPVEPRCLRTGQAYSPLSKGVCRVLPSLSSVIVQLSDLISDLSAMVEWKEAVNIPSKQLEEAGFHAQLINVDQLRKIDTAPKI